MIYLEIAGALFVGIIAGAVIVVVLVRKSIDAGVGRALGW